MRKFIKKYLESDNMFTDIVLAVMALVLLALVCTGIIMFSNY